MESVILISSLQQQTSQFINQAEQLGELSLQDLRWREHEKSWSILECLEHLNLYGEYYLPEIENAIQTSKTRAESQFKSGPIGGYFAKSMLPGEKIKKMKTFKDKDPIYAALDKSVLEKFMGQQQKFQELLTQSLKVSLNQVKIKTSISKFIRLKLGDTFQFMVNHNLRHLRQIDRIQNAMKK